MNIYTCKNMAPRFSEVVPQPRINLNAKSLLNFTLPSIPTDLLGKIHVPKLASAARFDATGVALIVFGVFLFIAQMIAREVLVRRFVKKYT